MSFSLSFFLSPQRFRQQLDVLLLLDLSLGRRGVMVVMMPMGMVVPPVMSFAALAFLLIGRYAPVPMVAPGALLALLAAVLSPATPSALGELAGVLFPFAALPVGALADAAAAVVFAAKVAHHDAGPVLHVALLGCRWGRMSRG